MLERHARRMARHRWWVVGAWAILVVVGFWLALGIGKVTTSQVTLPGTESSRGLNLIADNFAKGDSTSLQAVFRNPTATVDDPAFKAAVTASLARAAKVVPGTGVVSYYSSGSRNLVGDGGHLTFATLRLPLAPDDAKSKVTPIRQALGTPAGFEKTLVGGQAAADHDLSPITDHDLKKAEFITFPLALAILLVVFASLTSALLPILMALVTIFMSMGAVRLVGELTPLSIYVPNVITLIGIGIGIDYSLLLVMRFKEELRAGHDKDTALTRTVATAGHAAIFSGTTVAIGLAVLVLLNVPFIRSMGIGGMLVPIFAVLAGLTLLPALLAILGERVNSLRIVPRRFARAGDGRAWGAVANWIMRHARAVFALALIAMLALAAPSLGLSLHQNALADAPAASEAVQAGRILQTALGGAVNPDTLVIDTGRANGAYDPAAYARIGAFAAQLRGLSVVKSVTWPQGVTAEQFRASGGGGLVDATGRYALMNVAPLGDSLSDSARSLNATLKRSEADLEASLPGSQVTLTGEPAGQNDFIDAVYGPFPWLLALVLVLAYIALLRAFRSVLLPLKAVILNVISILATYGLMVLVFQHGWGLSLLGMDHTVRGIAPWIPVFLFAFLFGLSMDYEVFLISRMREIRDAGAESTAAVATGLQRTGRLVTSAALIMVVAFSGFVLGRSVDLKEFGFGLAAAIAIDATVIRVLLVPALMKLMGRWNWWLPERVARAVRLRPPRPVAAED